MQEDILFSYDWEDVLGQKKRLCDDHRHTAEGSSKGREVMALGISVLYVYFADLCIGLVFSGFVVAAKKAQRIHEEGGQSGINNVIFLYHN